MVIQINTTAKDTIAFVRKAIVNVRRSQTAMARRMGEHGRAEVQFLAPKWHGTLRNKVALKVFPNVHKAEIFMASSHFNEIALQNEFNIKGRRKLYKSAYPKLAQWAQEKGVFKDKPFVIVGGPNTRLGRQNKFFFPAFLNLQKAIPNIAAEVITKAISRTGG